MFNNKKLEIITKNIELISKRKKVVEMSINQLMDKESLDILQISEKINVSVKLVKKWTKKLYKTFTKNKENKLKIVLKLLNRNKRLNAENIYLELRNRYLININKIFIQKLIIRKKVKQLS